MVKTRGRKRASPKPPENEPPDFDEKRQKLDSETTSKYFNKDSETPIDDMKDSGLQLDQSSDDSNDLMVCTKSKQTPKLKVESDSDDSSSDEFMKAPFSLDDLGQFKSLEKTTNNSVEKSTAASSLLVSRLSDDSSNEQETKEQEFYDFSQIIQSQEIILKTKKEQEEKSTKKEVPPTVLSRSCKNNKISKKSSKKQATEEKSCIKSIGEELGISELLAMGEGTGIDVESDYESSDAEDSKEGIKAEETYSVPAEGVQVTIELPNVQQKRKSKGFDMEAAVKRRINLIRKENQILMHKVHTLCWIAHGIYLNRIINDDDLMGLALSLIPSKHCYPPKHADLNYLEKLVEWFVKKVIVNKDHKLAPNSSELSLLDVLESEINLTIAFSPRDLVLIFICMVRSLGINARLMISLRPVPLRPPASDLCTVSNKPKEESLTSDAKPISKKSLTPSKNKTTTEPEQLKGNLKSILKGRTSVSNQLDSSKTGPISRKSKLILEKSEKEKLRQVASSKLSPDLKSPYFSSSDEVPLKELISKSCSPVEGLVSKSRKKICIEKSSSKNSKVTEISRSKNNIHAKSKSESLEIKNVNGNKNKVDDVFVTSSYFNYEKQQNNTESKKKDSSKAVVNIESFKEEIEKRKVRSRRSVPATYHERNVSSSDDEVAITKIVSKPKRNAKTPQKSNPSSSTTPKKNKGPRDKAELDTDFEPSKPSTSRKTSIDRRVLSSDDDVNSPKKIGNDYWVEVFLEAEEKWISVDLRRGKVHCIQQLNSAATQPVRYVLAFNSDGTIKDVTRRYAPHWLTVTRKLRVEDAWWCVTMAPYKPHPSHRDRDEDEDLDRQMHDKPMPTNITEYKNHPLFALQRHLLKFEAIYPPDAPTLGFVRGEAVYSRGCVAELHTREAWIKEAKLVRRGEEPYKIVKARPKWDKMSQTVINNIPLPLFGHWQVEDYIPPPAVDGKVPRNEYGNVELYKPCMLPAGTVHLQVPQLARVARKLGIDCAPAVVGWEFSGGGSHPLLDGFIVCEEFKDILMDAWDKEMDESAKRAKEKVEQRVYGNWKRLIKGLLIRERLKARYDFGVPTPDKKKKKPQPKPGTSKS